MRWRVRSRRAMTHPPVSARRAASSSLFLACDSLLAAFAVAASASPIIALAPLKQGGAPRAPRLLFFRVRRTSGATPPSSPHDGIERIYPSSHDNDQEEDGKGKGVAGSE